MDCDCLLIAIKPHSDLAGWHATHYRKWLDIIDHDSPGGDDGSRSYGDARKHHRAEPDPYIVANLDAVLRRVCKSRIGSDPLAVCYEDSRRSIVVVVSSHDPNVVRDHDPSSDPAIDLNRTEPAYVCFFTNV